MNAKQLWEKYCQDQLQNKSNKEQKYQKQNTTNPINTIETKGNEGGKQNIELAHSNTFTPGNLTNNIVIRKNQNRQPKNSSGKDNQSG